ncbi:HET domain-containing protein [Fusarium falciforme]|uniref:HET domain-containing protein n=1 Tax=Fusarium falciforme TaxID=195108 RepID=UPI0023019DB4|nr:HET domain-containing protein [Fusarium falciforme]WAO94266.1 HET domain-containing protein [Fusarium falciforme]
MTPSRPTPQISQRAILSTEDSLQSSQAVPPAGQISPQAVAPQIVQPTDSSSLLVGYNEPDEEFHFIVSHYSDASSVWVEGSEPPTCAESWLESRRAHVFDVLPPYDQPRCKDDSEVPITSSRSVDYLSHRWIDEEIGPSWKAVSSAKSLINKGRLENGIWRAWTKFKNNLSTIPPEEINWFKDCDVTWLYGPLYPDSQSHPTDWQTDDKSILRRHRTFYSEFSSRGKKPIDLKVRIREEVEVIGHDGGIGYFEDENDDDTTIKKYTDTAL